MFKSILRVGILMDNALTEHDDGLACNSYYKGLLPNPLGVAIARWCMVRMQDHQPRADTVMFAKRHAVAIKPTDDWLRHNHIPYTRLYVTPHIESILVSSKPDILLSDKIEYCEFAYRQWDCKAILTEDKNVPWFSVIHSLAQFQRLYEGVAREKLLTDFDGARLAPDLPSL